MQKSGFKEEQILLNYFMNLGYIFSMGVEGTHTLLASEDWINKNNKLKIN